MSHVSLCHRLSHHVPGRFLQHAAAHPLIRKDETFKSFLQTETKVPKAKGSGLATMMAKLAGYNEGDEVEQACYSTTARASSQVI
jgi:hypothetical protein